ncbi:MAG TPA: HAD family phosphatase [Mycobacteriales bacterium]|nr:HAD family phosphatase [Mycobacteriales bacterium]
MAGRLRAVLLDMDGTLFDSEKLWTVSLGELATRLGGRLSAATRAAMVGTNVAETVVMLHDDLGVRADVAESGEWLLSRTKELYAGDLPWLPGARELVAAVRAAGLPTALVTSTPRDLVEVALRTIGAENVDAVVAGDEVRHNKPHPESYLRAAGLLGLRPADCLAVEDSPAGIASAEAAGCAVLAVPHHVPVPPGPRRLVRPSLAGLTVAGLTAVHTTLAASGGSAAGDRDADGAGAGVRGHRHPGLDDIAGPGAWDAAP